MATDTPNRLETETNAQSARPLVTRGSGLPVAMNNNQTKTVAVLDKPIAPKGTITHARGVSQLEALCVFSGDRATKLPDMTNDESIHLGVALIVRGEETKSRGVFVIADKVKSLSEDAAKTFAEDLRAFVKQDARERAVASVGKLGLEGDKLRKALEDAKKRADVEGDKRCDNLKQTIRAAQLMLEQPKAFTEGVSVFSVQQALAPLTNKEHPAHAAVKRLMQKPGVSQSDVKKVIADSKPEVKAPVDARTDEQKKTDAQESNKRDMVFRVQSTVALWDKMVAEGVPSNDIRSIRVNPKDENDKRTMKELVISLATLAGLTLQK